MDEIHLRRKDLANVRYVSWYFTEILQAIELPTKTEFRTVTTLTDAYYYQLLDTTYQLIASKNQSTTTITTIYHLQIPNRKTVVHRWGSLLFKSHQATSRVVAVHILSPTLVVSVNEQRIFVFVFSHSNANVKVNITIGASLVSNCIKRMQSNA